MKNLYFEGSSLDELRALPTRAKQVIGFQLERIQLGKDPINWKPLNGLRKGITGVREIRVEIDANVFRSANVTKFGDSIVVLRCWSKKSQKTSESDKKLIVERYKSARERFS